MSLDEIQLHKMKVKISVLSTRRKRALTAPTEKAGTGLQLHLRCKREKEHHSFVWKTHARTGNSPDIS